MIAYSPIATDVVRVPLTRQRRREGVRYGAGFSVSHPPGVAGRMESNIDGQTSKAHIHQKL